MYKQCFTDQSTRRQRQLEQGLLEVMRRRNYDEISVSELCEELGIPRKSFYRYFTCKDGALYALIDHTLMDFVDFSAEAERREGPSPMVLAEQICSYWVCNKPLLDALERNGKSGILIQRAMEYAKGSEQVPGLLRTAERQFQEYGTQFATCGMMTMMVQWYHNGYEPDAKQMAQLMLDLLSKPLIEMLDWT